MGSDSLLAVKRGGGAPHKPLLLLAALDLYRRGYERLIRFDQLEGRFRDLAGTLSPSRQFSVQEPFWRLQRDGIWEVTGLESAAAVPSRALLRSAETRGGLSSAAYQRVMSGDVNAEIATIIESYFQPADQELLRTQIEL